MQVSKQFKLISIALAALALGSGCAQKKAPELDEVTVLKLQRDQAKLQALQSAADPIIKEVNDLQEETKKKYPGYHIDLSSQKLVQDNSGQDKK